LGHFLILLSVIPSQLLYRVTNVQNSNMLNTYGINVHILEVKRRHLKPPLFRTKPSRRTWTVSTTSSSSNPTGPKERQRDSGNENMIEDNQQNLLGLLAGLQIRIRMDPH
jgi:hypothetical protein